jgi:branched-chain amino acid aminotransferase
MENGVNVGVSSWNRIAPNTLPTAAKAGGNYLSSQLISREAARHGYTEGIALDIHNYVSEGAGQNLFLIRKGILYTPPGSCSILPGLTRDTVITLAKQMGYEVREELIAREALYLADEFFMCGTATEIVPVSTVDGIQVGCGKRGEITKKIQDAFFGMFDGTTEVADNWLDPVK